MTNQRGAVVTGLGVTSALGSTVEDFWRNLLGGKSGFRLVEDLALPKRGCRIAAEVVYSIKGALGQTGAVTPALQAIAAVLSIENKILPPTVNVAEQDARCQINLVRNSAIEFESEIVLSNAIGFSGFYYATTVVSK